jgi:hypothetical protein
VHSGRMRPRWPPRGLSAGIGVVSIGVVTRSLYIPRSEDGLLGVGEHGDDVAMESAVTLSCS